MVPVFQQTLQLDGKKAPVGDTIELNGKRVHLYAPSTLAQLVAIATNNKGARFIATGIITRLSLLLEDRTVLVKTFNPAQVPETWISLQRIPELRDISFKDGILRLGSATTITEFVEAVALYDKEKRLQALVDVFKKYSSTQVRNTTARKSYNQSGFRVGQAL